jgi:predicted AlkP superfamily pyrophosphatase or phosphodiesterase
MWLTTESPVSRHSTTLNRAQSVDWIRGCATGCGKHRCKNVVLVSLDGFRYDYTERYGAKNLYALATQGASAPEGMIPVYPSVTFSNQSSCCHCCQLRLD